MPPNKRRSSASVYKTKEPVPKQRHLASPSRVTKRVKPKTPATIPKLRERQDTLTQRGFDLCPQSENVDLHYSEGSDAVSEEKLPRKRRKTMTQTLTQGGFVFHQDPEELDLKYERDTNMTFEEAPSKRKRRRILPEEPVTRQTRSASKRILEKVVKTEENRVEHRNSEVKSEDNSLASRQLPPPRTPQSSRKREVPSSQSPVDTPPSIHSLQLRQDFPRSPLQEKSTNVRRRATSTGKITHRARMLEVADSMDVPLKTKESIGSTSNSIDVYASVDDFMTNSSSHEASNYSHQAPKPDKNSRIHNNRIVKSEVSDTEPDEDEDADEEADIYTFLIPNMPQPASTNTDSRSNRLIHKKDLISTKAPELSAESSEISNTTASSLSSNRTERHPSNIASQQPNPNSNNPDLSLPSLPSQSSTIPQTPHQMLPPPLSTPKTPTPLSPSLHSHPAPQPPSMPNTEPQLERTPHNHPPPPHQTPQLPTLPLEPQPQPQPQPLTPIPPSQASTVDITQPSPPCSRHLPTSSSPLPPLSSSPLDLHMYGDGGGYGVGDGGGDRGGDRGGDGEDLGTWDGVRLTDSQLLPDSILNDGFGAPLLEGWEVEEEEEEEEEE